MSTVMSSVLRLELAIRVYGDLQTLPQTQISCKKNLIEQPRVTPRPIRTKKFGFLLSQADQRNHGQGEKNPNGENAQGINFFKTAGQDQRYSHAAMKEERPTWCAKRRLDPLYKPEELAGLSQCIRDTRASQEVGVKRSECG